MPRFFYGNFDFEHQLASAAYGTATGAASSLTSSLASCWLGLAEDDDQIYLPASVPEEFSAQLQASGFPHVHFASDWPAPDTARSLTFVPWGWSAAMSQLAHSKGFSVRAPDLTAVRTVNARAFSFQLETEWGIALPGSCQVEDLTSLEQTLKALPDSADSAWVLKANFSMSARERMYGRGNQLIEPIRSWAAKRLAQGQPLFLEPWVERISEAGLQLEIPHAGEPTFVGLAMLLNDARGQYRGSRIHVDESTLQEWQPALEVAQRVARAVQQAGYVGALGIDAMQYRTADGEMRFRPLQDLNARYTMGRLALGFQRFLAADEVARWLHFPWKESYGIDFSNWLRCVASQGPAGNRLQATSPDRIDGQCPRLASVLLIAGNQADLQTGAAALTDAQAKLNQTTG
ncbi:hypothetical protein [Gimesia panareensis]|uniref:Uncharacterized protein n=1 Tax=Gimesia panareensis TaxID=2527978 RepID=A0A518A0S6_9PLAN|nr:hypothetical protein [Gimesia panareensis]QDT25372.1 hypothetical protein Enr10x_06670 [Gimesia panareensis]QDU48332.1 hypothetical protein Pan110_06450 [Gimesia panareensis]